MELKAVLTSHSNDLLFFLHEDEFHEGTGKPRESSISTGISRLSLELSFHSMRTATACSLVSARKLSLSAATFKLNFGYNRMTGWVFQVCVCVCLQRIVKCRVWSEVGLFFRV